MIRTLFLCLALMQISPTTKVQPVIDNERVKVWDTTGADPQPFDTVVVSANGNVSWSPKGATPKLDGRSVVINLKDHAVAPLDAEA